jgi:hypothetical protein
MLLFGEREKMPFKSEAQRSFMWVRHPGIARRWSVEYPVGRKLPARVLMKRRGWVGMRRLREMV